MGTNTRKKTKKNHTFELYDLRIEVHKRPSKKMICNHKEGSFFYLQGENIIFPKGTTFPIYSLASLIPILPAKQRVTDPYDWITTDEYVACPDPHCGGLFKIVRLPNKRTFHRYEVTAVKL